MNSSPYAASRPRLRQLVKQKLEEAESACHIDKPDFDRLGKNPKEAADWFSQNVEALVKKHLKLVRTQLTQEQDDKERAQELVNLRTENARLKRTNTELAKGIETQKTQVEGYKKHLQRLEEEEESRNQQPPRQSVSHKDLLDKENRIKELETELKEVARDCDKLTKDNQALLEELNDIARELEIARAIDSKFESSASLADELAMSFPNTPTVVNDLVPIGLDHHQLGTGAPAAASTPTMEKHVMVTTPSAPPLPEHGLHGLPPGLDHQHGATFNAGQRDDDDRQKGEYDNNREDKVGQITRFSGTNRNKTATSHWAELSDYWEERVAQIQKWVDNNQKEKVADTVDYRLAINKARKFKHSLTGKARDWFDSLGLKLKDGDKYTDDDLKELEKRFLEQFGDDGIGRYEQSMNFMNLKWDGKEKLQDFALRISRLGKILGKDDMDLKIQFLRGLPLDLQSRLMANPKMNLQECVDAAVQILLFQRQYAGTSGYGPEVRFTAVQTPAGMVPVQVQTNQAFHAAYARPGEQVALPQKSHTAMPATAQPNSSVTESQLAQALKTLTKTVDRLNSDKGRGNSNDHAQHGHHRHQGQGCSQSHCSHSQLHPSGQDPAQDALIKQLTATIAQLSTNQQASGGDRGSSQQGNNPRKGFQAPYRDRRGGYGNNQGRNNYNRREIDVPNVDQWKDSMQQGLCGLHGGRGRPHTTQECRMIQELVRNGMIALDDDGTIVLGQGKRFTLN